MDKFVLDDKELERLIYISKTTGESKESILERIILRAYDASRGWDPHKYCEHINTSYRIARKTKFNPKLKPVDVWYEVEYRLGNDKTWHVLTHAYYSCCDKQEVVRFDSVKECKEFIESKQAGIKEGISTTYLEEYNE